MARDTRGCVNGHYNIEGSQRRVIGINTLITERRRHAPLATPRVTISPLVERWLFRYYHQTSFRYANTRHYRFAGYTYIEWRRLLLPLLLLPVRERAREERRQTSCHREADREVTKANSVER